LASTGAQQKKIRDMAHLKTLAPIGRRSLKPLSTPPGHANIGFADFEDDRLERLLNVATPPSRRFKPADALHAPVLVPSLEELRDSLPQEYLDLCRTVSQHKRLRAKMDELKENMGALKVTEDFWSEEDAVEFQDAVSDAKETVASMTELGEALEEYPPETWEVYRIMEEMEEADGEIDSLISGDSHGLEERIAEQQSRKQALYGALRMTLHTAKAR
jgi:hypothetical protein